MMNNRNAPMSPEEINYMSTFLHDQNNVTHECSTTHTSHISIDGSRQQEYHSNEHTSGLPRNTTAPASHAPLQATQARDQPRDTTSSIPQLDDNNSTRRQQPTTIPIIQGLETIPEVTLRRLEDNCYIGDGMQLPKATNTTRIYFQNVNGINISSTGNWIDVCEHIRDMEVDVALLVEHKLDTNQPRVLKGLHDGARNIFGQGMFAINATSTTTQAHTNYKPGGVMSIVHGGIKGRILQSDKDPMGRWVTTTFRRNLGPPITVFATYQVVDVDPKQTGPTTYANQLFAMYTQQGRQNPEKLRLHHANDLIECIKQHQAKGECIILAGDMNEVLGVETGGLTRLHTECGLVDACLQQHGITDFTSYQRGKQVIDYILVDATIMQNVQSCGYEPFHIHILSDHRGIFLDIHTAQCFGSTILPLQPIQLRDISTKRSHQIAPYFEEKNKHLLDHSWYKKVQELQVAMDKNEPDHELAEELYERLVCASKHAGSTLKKFPPAPYSPAIARLRNVHRLLKLAVTQHTTSRDMSENIARTAAKMGDMGYKLPETLESCKKALVKCTKQLKEVIRDELATKNLRRNHQDKLIESYEAQGNSKLAKKIRGIQRAEKVKRVFQRCRAARNLGVEGGLTHVLVPENQDDNPRTCQQWRRVDNPSELAQCLMTRNRAHFGQSKGCTLTSPPLDFTMKFSATCDVADSILNGTYLQPNTIAPTPAFTEESFDSSANVSTDSTDSETLSEDTATTSADDDENDSTDPAPNEPLHLQRNILPELVQLLIDSFRYTTTPDVIPPHLTEKEYKSKLKVWNEQTSTSPTSNMHLGHLKSYWAEHTLPDGSKEAKELNEIRQRILDGHLLLINYAIHFGYSYDKWKCIVNTMLEKDKGMPKIHRLRVIHLYEADYNLILGVKWRQVLHHAATKGLINEGCYGSQPGKEALDALLIRELEYEISRLTRKPCLHFDNDATSCYDRIPCFLANLASRKYGMHRKICVVQGETLAEARYYLKTKYGVSEEFIKHSRPYPIFGTGQGSGNSPTYWLFISSTLFDMYDIRALGSTYQTRDAKLSVKVKAIGFVDDVRTSINVFENNEITLEQLIALATRDSQLWHDILSVSNQALELPKCGYHAIIFDFEPTGTPIMVDNPECQITLSDTNARSFDINKWKTSQATKYLGAYKAPGSQKQQAQALQRKCDDFSRVINCSHLTRTETQCFYWTIYRLSANYVLPTTYFTKDELQRIQARAHRSMVGRSGYCRTTAGPVIFGPKKYGGAGFFHLYDDQGYGQIRMFMKLWRSPKTQAGKLLRVVVSWAQYCVGTGAPVLQDVTTKWPHYEAKWLNSLRNYLRDIGGQIRLNDHGVCKLQRVNDQFIMDVAISSKKFGPAALRRINYCRMYLNVLLLSDITMPNGKHIDAAAYSGDRDSLHSVESGHRANQARPNEKAWAEWRTCLNLLVNKISDHSLTTPLGAWIVPPQEYARDWKLLYSATEDVMYQRTAVDYSIHHRLTHDYDKDTEEFTDALPPDAVPTDMKQTPSTWIRTGTAAAQDIPQEDDPPTTVADMIATMPTWERQLLQLTVFIVPEDQVWKALCNGKCYVASDGSAPKGKGSFAWILSDKHGERLARCSGPVFGHAISSYRAEAYGMLSFLRFLLCMARIYPETGGGLRAPHLVCDNQGLITTITTVAAYPSIFPNTTMDAEWDCIAEILAAIKTLQSISPTIDHIKGHQDEKTPYEELPLLAQLNCDADAHANTFLQNHPNIDHASVGPQFPSGECNLHLRHGTVTRNFKHECTSARTLPAYKKFLAKKHTWSTESVFDTIDWDAHGHALKRHEKHRVTFVKYLHGVLPVGKQAHRYDPKYPPSCPSCHHGLEDMNHFWRCPAESRLKWRRKFLKDLDAKLIELGTGPQVRELLVSKLRAILDGENPYRVPEDPQVASICQQQRSIKWENLLLGRFAKAWNDHERTQPSTDRQSHRHWTTEVVDFIFSQVWTLWEMRNQDRHGRDLATRQQADARQVDRELTLLYDKFEGRVPQHLGWIFETPLEIRRQWATSAARQWLNTWYPILSEAANPEAMPTNPENYPYNTALETG